MLLALILAQLSVPSVKGPIFSQPSTMGSLAYFEAFNGRGTTTACSTTAPTDARGVPYTYVRPGNQWCTNDDYSLTLMSANQPAIMRGRPGGSLGPLIEPAGQNDFLNNRDLSQASTVKLLAACTKTATGVDGVANSASRCTSSAINGTVLQAIVRASAANATSAYVRRNGGTSGIEVTRDNGTTWTAITSSLTSSYKRVVCRDTEGCMGGRCIVVADMCATSANPTVGFRIVGSGDSIDIDLVQNEASTQNTSPMTTAGVAGTRSAITSSYFDLPVTLATLRMMSASTVAGTGAANRYLMEAYKDAANFSVPYMVSTDTDSLLNLGCTYFVASASVTTGTTGGAPAGGSWNVTCDSNGITKQACFSGQCAATTTSGSIPSLSGVTRVYVGTTHVGASTNWLGVVSEVSLDGDTRGGPPRSSRPAGTHIVWLGDSITNGVVSAPTRPTYELYKSYAQLQSRMVVNAGVATETVAQMKARWDSYISGSGYGTLVFLGGVNDIVLGASAAATYATVVQILDGAKARGMRVVVLGMTPWASYATWSAAKQTQTDAYNALLSAWATANSQTYVSTDSMGTGSPLSLSAGFNSGDGLHPNAAGSVALAALAAGGLP